MTLGRIATSLFIAWLASLPLVAADLPIPTESLGVVGVFAAFDKESVYSEFCSKALPGSKAEFGATMTVLARRMKELGGDILATDEFKDMTRQSVHETVIATIKYERSEAEKWRSLLVKPETCQEGHKNLRSATDAELKESLVRGLKHFRDVAKRADAYVPICYTEPLLKIKICSEGDGRHLQAVDSAGKTLWRRNPFVDAKLEAYRNGFPRIAWIGANDCPSFERLPTCVGISYDSSQFGVVSIRDGSFQFMGQD